MNPCFLRIVATLGLTLAATAAHADAFQDCRARADRRLMATEDTVRHQTDMRHCYRTRREGASGGGVVVLEPAPPVNPVAPPGTSGAKPAAPIKPR